MTALERIAALRAIMGERTEIDSQRPLARQHFRLDLTLQLLQLSPLFRHLNTTDFDSADGSIHLNRRSQEVQILHLVEVENVHMRPFN